MRFTNYSASGACVAVCLVVVAVVLPACLKPDEPSGLAQDRLVVQGWLPVVEQRHTLHIGLLFSAAVAEFVPSDEASEVRLIELGHEVKEYLYLPEAGEVYRMQAPMIPERGSSYYLEFVWRERRYRSQVEAFGTLPADLRAEARVEECANGLPALCYRLFLSFRDDPSSRDHYRLQMSRNGQLLVFPPTEELFFDGIQNGERLERRIGPLPFEVGEEVRLHLWSVSEVSYAYLQAVLLQLREDRHNQLLLPLRAPSSFWNVSSGENDGRIIGYFGLLDSTSVALTIPFP